MPLSHEVSLCLNTQVESLTVTMFVPFHCISILSMKEKQMAHYKRIKVSAGEGF